MNEQIKQLWEDAAKTTQSDSWEEQTKFMERFAELIVQECANQVDWILAEGGKTQGDLIREHFGVEE
jgi:hypothetical protein